MNDDHRLIEIAQHFQSIQFVLSEMTSPRVSSSSPLFNHNCSPESFQLSSINGLSEDDHTQMLMEKLKEDLQRMELEYKYEEEQEEFEYEEFKFEVEEMMLPRVSTWINAADGTTLQGMVMVINDGGCRVDERINRCEFDVCLICFETWTSHGNHQLCCLPCGHIYGMSCITKWLQSSGRCPECNTSCTLNDVRLLYATRLCVADHKASTTFFPFTEQGFEAFKQYLSKRRTDMLQLLADVVVRQVDVLDRESELAGRRAELVHRLAEAVKPVRALRTWSDALGGLVELLMGRADAFKRQVDALAKRANAMERQIDALDRRGKAYKASIDFFQQRCLEHMKSAQH